MPVTITSADNTWAKRNVFRNPLARVFKLGGSVTRIILHWIRPWCLFVNHLNIPIIKEFDCAITFPCIIWNIIDICLRLIWHADKNFTQCTINTWADCMIYFTAQVVWTSAWSTMYIIDKEKRKRTWSGSFKHKNLHHIVLSSMETHIIWFFQTWKRTSFDSVE